MPSKCPFCRDKYIRSATYQKDLATAHTNVDSVLASTVGYLSSGDIINDVETSTLHHLETSEFYDSDYESDPDPSGHERDVLTTHKSDTKTPDHSLSALPGTQEHYPRDGEAIRDIGGFEEETSNICEHPWAPFSCAQGFKLPSLLIQSKVPKSSIKEYFSSGLSTSAFVSYSSLHTVENHLRSLDRHSSYQEWFEEQVEDSTRTLPFLYGHVMDCGRYLLLQIAYQDDLVDVPRRESDPNGERIHSEMHTADWLWDIQVQRPHPLYTNVS